MQQKTSKCQKSLSMRLLIETVTSPPKKLYVTIRNQQVVKLAELAKVNLATSPKKDLILAILNLSVLKVVYDTRSKKVTNVDLKN